LTSTQAPGKTLITFDVDGTLIKAVGAHANKFHKDAFAHAFKIVHGLDTNIDVIAHHGSTDQLVIESVLKHHGVERDVIWAKMPECCDAMLAYAYGSAAAGFAATGLELLPGVKELLSRLAERDDCVVALVTGNLERIAWIKMKALGVEGLFTKPGIGGFGSDDTERGALVRIARKRCLEKLGVEVVAAVHVGDTPNDVKAAEVGDAKAIAVTTGVFDADALLNAAGDKANVTVMDGLTDVDAVLRACGLAP